MNEPATELLVRVSAAGLACFPAAVGVALALVVLALVVLAFRALALAGFAAFFSVLIVHVLSSWVSWPRDIRFAPVGHTIKSFGRRHQVDAAENSKNQPVEG